MYGRTRARYYDVQARAWCSFLWAHPLASVSHPSRPNPPPVPSSESPWRACLTRSLAAVVLPLLGRSIVSVTWTLCEAASIKPHFYSGTLHSLRPSGLSRPFFPLAHCSFAHPHFMDPPAPSRKAASCGVPLRPLRVRLRTRGHDILVSRVHT